MEAVAGEARVELRQDPTDERGPLIDEGRIELQGRGAGADLGIGIGTTGDAADTDQRKRNLVASGDWFESLPARTSCAQEVCPLQSHQPLLVVA